MDKACWDGVRAASAWDRQASTGVLDARKLRRRKPARRDNAAAARGDAAQPSRTPPEHVRECHGPTPSPGTPPAGRTHPSRGCHRAAAAPGTRGVRSRRYRQDPDRHNASLRLLSGYRAEFLMRGPCSYPRRDPRVVVVWLDDELGRLCPGCRPPTVGGRAGRNRGFPREMRRCRVNDRVQLAAEAGEAEPRKRQIARRRGSGAAAGSGNTRFLGPLTFGHAGSPGGRGRSVRILNPFVPCGRSGRARRTRLGLRSGCRASVEECPTGDHGSRRERSRPRRRRLPGGGGRSPFVRAGTTRTSRGSSTHLGSRRAVPRVPQPRFDGPCRRARRTRAEPSSSSVAEGPRTS